MGSDAGPGKWGCGARREGRGARASAGGGATLWAGGSPPPPSDAPWGRPPSRLPCPTLAVRAAVVMGGRRRARPCIGRVGGRRGSKNAARSVRPPHPTPFVAAASAGPASFGPADRPTAAGPRREPPWSLQRRPTPPSTHVIAPHAILLLSPPGGGGGGGGPAPPGGARTPGPADGAFRRLVLGAGAGDMNLGEARQ